MNQTQLQQEPETTLTRMASSPFVSETAASLETSEVAEQYLFEKLVITLEQNKRRREKWNRIILNIYMAFVAIFFLLMGIGWISGRSFVPEINLYYLNIINVLGWGIGIFLLDKKAATELTTLNDTRCAGALVEIWNPQGQIRYDRNTRKQAETALIRLLPRLKASDALLLKEHQRVILRTVLDMQGYKQWGKYHDTRFMLAILTALTETGDWKSAPSVLKLSKSSRDPQLQRAATECLPFLQDMAKKQTVGENLLRASSATEATNTAPETLLRPASSTTDAHPETLLRPAE